MELSPHSIIDVAKDLGNAALVLVAQKICGKLDELTDVFPEDWYTKIMKTLGTHIPAGC